MSCKLITCVCLSLLLAPCAHAGNVRDGVRGELNFDRDWLFALGDPSAAKEAGFDDAEWRKLDVPHDWSIEGEFDRDAPAGGAGAFLPTGVAWYRKHFTVPESDSARRVFIEFDGVMANSDVYINDFALGHRPYGYVSFRYDLTPHVHFGGGGEGAKNVLAVRVDNSKQPASRWYAGAGINRHVRLVVVNPVHFGYHATFLTTPTIAANSATVRVRTTVVNESHTDQKFTVAASVHGPPGSAPDGGYACAGESAPQSVAAGKSADVELDVNIPWPPRLWDLDHRDMHRAVVQIRSAGETLDEQTIPFGIREFRFEPETGFWLNGKNFKLKGVCLHNDAGGLGTAVPLGAWRRRLATLKTLGVNAIRTAHNPPAPEFLDLCDEMGLLVMDEMFDCWTVGKNRFDYHLYFNEWSKIDARDTVLRDRNHPSIILWSAGNEIHDTPRPEVAKPILAGLVEKFHAADPTRPVTQALFRPNVSHDYDNGLADMLDVVGQNYRENEILAAHAQKPARKIVGTENGHERRGWLALRDNAPYAGQFLWTGIDYLGESRSWPNIGAGAGLVDRTGAVKPMGRERQSWWSEQPMVFITRRTAPPTSMPSDPGFAPLRRPIVLFSDWTPPDLALHEENVEVYSNCADVELILNGRSLGSKPLNQDASPRTWRVPFEPGTIKAVAKDGQGTTVADHELRTAGKPSKITLAADQTSLTPEWDDVAYVTATVVDDQGVVVPTASNDITFTLTGPGTIAAVDNADNASHEPFHGTNRRAFGGRCIAILRANRTPVGGNLHLMAESPELASASVELKVTAQP